MLTVYEGAEEYDNFDIADLPNQYAVELFGITDLEDLGSQYSRFIEQALHNFARWDELESKEETIKVTRAVIENLAYLHDDFYPFHEVWLSYVELECYLFSAQCELGSYINDLELDGVYDCDFIDTTNDESSKKLRKLAQMYYVITSAKSTLKDALLATGEPIIKEREASTGGVALKAFCKGVRGESIQ
jgi:hypothetical protein